MTISQSKCILFPMPKYIEEQKLRSFEKESNDYSKKHLSQGKVNPKQNSASFFQL